MSSRTRRCCRASSPPQAGFGVKPRWGLVCVAACCDVDPAWRPPGGGLTLGYGMKPRWGLVVGNGWVLTPDSKFFNGLLEADCS